jgi:hypothetical protein
LRFFHDLLLVSSAVASWFSLYRASVSFIAVSFVAAISAIAAVADPRPPLADVYGDDFFDR